MFIEFDENCYVLFEPSVYIYRVVGMSYLFARLRAYPSSPKLPLRRPQLDITFIDTACLPRPVTGWLWQVSFVGDVEAAAAVDLN